MLDFNLSRNGLTDGEKQPLHREKNSQTLGRSEGLPPNERDILSLPTLARGVGSAGIVSPLTVLGRGVPRIQEHVMFGSARQLVTGTCLSE